MHFPMSAQPALTRLAMSVGLAAIAVIPAHAVTIDWVTVGDPGNANDSTGSGAVPYEYQIGKYETTIQQYTDFLNAAAKSDPYSLYNANMALDLNSAGISRTGSSGSYTYSVMNNSGSSGHRPITYVSWWDAARFANWLHNGQGSSSTETGAYTLNGATGGMAPARNQNATVYVPTGNEWYKAAYFSPVLNFGSGGFYTYATQSNTQPGNVVGSVANQANYVTGVGFSVTQSPTYSPSQNYLTDVGAFTNSASHYGTFDQSGNVWEWNDSDGGAGLLRGIKGGDWDFDWTDLTSSAMDAYDTDSERYDLGFRLASPVAVPEPSTCAMGLAGLACAGWQVWRRRQRVA
jgi:sulfatase modifying factor 1